MKRLIFLPFTLACAAAFAQTTYGPGPGGIVPDANATGFSSTLNIGVGITSVNWIEIQGLRHTWAGDLAITVTAPGGASVTLFDRIGFPVAPFGDDSNFGSDGTGSSWDTLTGRTYRFQVGGADLIAHLASINADIGATAGTYAPTNADDSLANFTSFNGTAPGDWILTIKDLASGDTGQGNTFDGWTINANPVPEPATMAALGLGALALIRRKRKQA
jgi:hypothetical protein